MMDSSLERIWQLVASIWSFTLWKIDTHTVTVGHLIVAFLVLIIGVVLARYARQRLHLRLAPKTHIDEGGKATLEKLTFYGILVLAVYVAIAVLHVPLTAFHFMAGGLAVGVGFGGKELFSNLISGIILMVERPLKIGDVVEVKDEIGKIADIGLRSVRIHTEENMDIMFPNNMVLNEKVINWTKQDHVVLTKVSIGIGYESDIHRSTDLMLSAVREIQGVLPNPEPFVLFKEHGSSTLNFDVYFSVRVNNKMERWVYESKANYNLDDTLRAAGVEISFTQLDVHLKTLENKGDPFSHSKAEQQQSSS